MDSLAGVPSSLALVSYAYLGCAFELVCSCLRLMFILLYIANVKYYEMKHPIRVAKVRKEIRGWSAFLHEHRTEKSMA